MNEVLYLTIDKYRYLYHSIYTIQYTHKMSRSRYVRTLIFVFGCCSRFNRLSLNAVSYACINTFHLWLFFCFATPLKHYYHPGISKSQHNYIFLKYMKMKKKNNTWNVFESNHINVYEWSEMNCVLQQQQQQWKKRMPNFFSVNMCHFYYQKSSTVTVHR